MDRRQLFRLGAALGLWSAIVPVFRGVGQAAAPQLDRHSKDLLNAIAETFIPTTDTIGAGGIGLADFIDLIASDWMYDEERARFMQGLADFDSGAVRARGKTFVALPPPARLDYVAEVQAEGRAAMEKGAQHAPFIVWMKRLTVYGYYTSEVGASQELQLNLIPGQYDNCAPIHAGDRAFSLDRHNFHFAIDNETVAAQ